MKNKRTKTLLAALAIITLTISSCKKPCKECVSTTNYYSVSMLGTKTLTSTVTERWEDCDTKLTNSTNSNTFIIVGSSDIVEEEVIVVCDYIEE